MTCPSTTHHKGCECWEEQRTREIAERIARHLRNEADMIIEVGARFLRAAAHDIERIDWSKT